MDSSVYPNKDVIVASKLVVSIYCHNENEHAEDKAYGNEKWCEHVYGVKCEEHRKNHTDTSNIFFKGSIPNPTTILCTPDGTEIKRKTGSMAPKEFVDMVKEAAAKVGPGIGQDEYLFAKGKMKASDASLSEQKVKDAIASLTAVTKQFGKHPTAKKLAEEAQGKLDKINEAGLAIVDQAKEDAAAGKVEDAKKALRDVYANYKGLDCAKAAEKAMAELPKEK